MRQNLVRISPNLRHKFFRTDQFLCNDWACLVFPNHLEQSGTNLERLEQLKHPGDSPEIRQRSFAALRMTKPQAVTPSLLSGQALSAAKGLDRRTERSFAALRMTCRTPLEAAHGKSSLQMSRTKRLYLQGAALYVALPLFNGKVTDELPDALA